MSSEEFSANDDDNVHTHIAIFSCTCINMPANHGLIKVKDKSLYFCLFTSVILNKITL
jgi:hypothetical protein